MTSIVLAFWDLLDTFIFQLTIFSFSIYIHNEKKVVSLSMFSSCKEGRKNWRNYDENSLFKYSRMYFLFFFFFLSFAFLKKKNQRIHLVTGYVNQHSWLLEDNVIFSFPYCGLNNLILIKSVLLVPRTIISLVQKLIRNNIK